MFDECAKCGGEITKRFSTKILVQSGTYGTPKKLCWICDRCLPSFLDELEVAMPDDTKKPRQLRKLCRKCYNFCGTKANYCPHCGDNLNAQAEKES